MLIRELDLTGKKLSKAKYKKLKKPEQIFQHY